MSPLTLRHKLPSHVFASHHLRLAFAPLRACSALPCSCLEPSALGVRPALSLPFREVESCRQCLAGASASAVRGLRSRIASVSLRRNAPSPQRRKSLRKLSSDATTHPRESPYFFIALETVCREHPTRRATRVTEPSSAISADNSSALRSPAIQYQ